MRDSKKLEAKGSTERGKETPLSPLNFQWSLGPITPTAQPTKHKSVLKKRGWERERKEKKSKPKPLKEERRNDDTLVVVGHWRKKNQHFHNLGWNWKIAFVLETLEGLWQSQNS